MFHSAIQSQDLEATVAATLDHSLAYSTDTQATVLTGALARTAGETVAGSPYAITQGTLVASGNYTIGFTGSTLAITPATLTIGAQARTKAYGATDPTLTFTASGFQFTDTQATVLTGALARAAGETVAGGPYAITQGTLAASGNYTIGFTGSTLAITPATLTIGAQAKTKAYGATDPTLTFTASGFQFTDTQATALTGALARAAGETVAGGPYAITQGTLVASGNYTIGFTGSTLAITPAALIVTASSQSKTYGATLTLGTNSFASNGLQNGETIGGVTLTANGSPAGTAATAAAGPYTITPSVATGGTFDAVNYTISYVTGMLTVDKAALSVTADAKIKTSGTFDPAFTASYSGFVNGESSTVLLGTLTFVRATGETVGSYLITPSGVTSANYAITFNTGILTIITAQSPVILEPVVTATNVVITWSAVSNGNYRVQFKSILNATNWTDLTGNVLSSGTTASKTDIKTSINRFYRIQILP